MSDTKKLKEYKSVIEDLKGQTAGFILKLESTIDRLKDQVEIADNFLETITETLNIEDQIKDLTKP